MAKEPENLVLEHLRALREILDHHSQAFTDIQLRLNRLEKRLELADGK